MRKTWSAAELAREEDTKTFFADWDGSYTSERQALHDQLVKEELEGHSGQSAPCLVLCSGGAGAGKSDAARQARELLEDPVYVNTDEMRAALPEFALLVVGTDKAALLQEEASDVRNQLLAEAVASRMNVIWDAPGSPSVAALLALVEESGYSVAIAYTHRPVEEARAAARQRASQSANPADRRIVPDHVMDESHRKARAGFNLMARVPGREVTVYDKTGKARGEVADVIFHRALNGDVTTCDPERVKRFAKASSPEIDETLFLS